MRLQPQPRIRRRPTAVGHVTGLAVFVAGCGLVLSALVGFTEAGRGSATLLGVGLAVGLPGLALWRLTEVPERVPLASIFAAVTASWIALSLASTMAYLAAGAFDRFDDALFESVSGFTTTGATLLRPIEGLGAGILFWRQLTQWLGGMGVVVLAVAVLPVLGVGGLEMLRAETPGPTSERIAPRVRDTAKRLWILYVVLTAIFALLYFVAGMGWYDAIAHSLTTVSTGGFSPHDLSFAHFDSVAIEWVSIVGMVVGAMSFPLLWHAVHGRAHRLFGSVEFRGYCAIILGMSALAVPWNAGMEGMQPGLARRTIFSIVATATSTGYTVTDYTAWSSFPQLLMLFGMAVGGMTLSTSGGFTVFRVLVVLGYGRRQVIEQLHPRAVVPVRLGREIVPEDVVGRVIGFFGLYMAMGALATIATAASGVDLATSISAGAATLGNEGPGLGAIGPDGHYLEIGAGSRIVLMITMLVGRLEIFPMLLGTVALARWLEQKTPNLLMNRKQR